MGRDPTRDGGFTLLEVLAAFVIAALALGALTQAAGGGLQSARVAGHLQEALSRAKSRLAAASLAPRPGEASGDDGGGYAWRVRTARLLATPPQPADQGSTRPGVELYSIQVTVSWSLDGGTREVVLETRRIGLAPAEAP